MGRFSWMFADTDNKEALNLCGEAYVALPDGGYIFEPAYDCYGHFGSKSRYDSSGSKDIFDLVADWNRAYLAAHPEYAIPQHGEIDGRRPTSIPVSDYDWYKAYADLSLTPEQVAEKSGVDEYRWIGICLTAYDDQNAALPYPIKICKDKPRPGDYAKLPASNSDPNQGESEIPEAEDDEPVADVAPVVHAKWVYGEDMEAVTGTTTDSSWTPYIKGEYCHYCSSCRTRAVCGEDTWGYDTEDILTPYCPWCGAEMDAD